MENKEYTNEMIDKLMSVMVPTFCYRDKDVVPTTQRVGFAELDDMTFEVWSEVWSTEDEGLSFNIEDLNISSDDTELREATICLFDKLIHFARKEYGLMVSELVLNENGKATITLE